MYSVSDEHGNELQIGIDPEPTMLSAYANGWFGIMYLDHEYANCSFLNRERLELTSVGDMETFLDWICEEFPGSWCAQNHSMLYLEGEDGDFIAAIFFRKGGDWFNELRGLLEAFHWEHSQPFESEFAEIY